MLDNRNAMMLINPHSGLYECQVCGQRASPNVGEKGRMPRGYRRCPNGCTVEA
jgi:hypothetical protein